MPFTTTPGMHIEEVDGTWLVLIPGRNEVAHLSGAEAQAFGYALRGAGTIPTDLEPAMAALVELGVVTSNSWTRRKVLGLGGSAAAAAISVVALPSVAAASSSLPDTSIPTTEPSGPAGLAVSYLVVGGGGGTDTWGTSGGGGGGGVLQGTTTLARGSTTTVTVGDGGAKGDPPTNGAASSLGAIAVALGGGYGAGPNRAAGTGASGGGGNGWWANSTGMLNPDGAPGTAGQGNAGGGGVYIGWDVSDPYLYSAAGGGGGGASENGRWGSAAYPTRAGTGGKGAYSAIGEKCLMGHGYGWFGGGGTAGTADSTYAQPIAQSSVSDGGGGSGYWNDYPSAGASRATAGRPNTGGGGGGGGAAGGSGVVIVSYRTADAVGLTVTGGNKVIIPTDDWDDEANYAYRPADGMTYRLFTTVGAASLSIT